MSDGPAEDLETLLQELHALVDRARAMPMSSSVLVNRDEALELIEHASARLPEELRQARWLLKERDEFLGLARREADDIIEAARSQVERMVERTEIAREARRVAERVVDEAEADARRLRHEAEDYVDQRLAAFEIMLERTLAAVREGRDRLQVVVEPFAESGAEGADTSAETAFFDQDEA